MWANKKQNNFNNYNIAFKKTTWRYHYFTPVYQKSPWFMIYSLQQTEIGNFRSIFALLLPYKPKISKLWKNGKNCWRNHHLTHVYKNSQSYDVLFLRYGVRQNFLSFWAIFCPFTPLMIPKIKILKKWKNFLEILSIYTCVP